MYSAQETVVNPVPLIVRFTAPLVAVGLAGEMLVMVIGTPVPGALKLASPSTWPVSEYEEMLTLRPGLHDLAGHILAKLVSLCRGEEGHGISEYKLHDNPYWPAELASRWQ